MRSFVALSEELHFSRAARRLRIAQPALRQQLRRLETFVGIELVRRSSRSAEMTAAGTDFLAEARLALAAAARATTAAKLAAGGDRPRLRVGFLAQAAAEATSAMLAGFREHCPEVVVDLRAMSFSNHLAALHTGDVELSLLRPPYGEQELAGISMAALFAEPRVAVLPAEHPLAGRQSLRVAEIIDETFVRISAHASRVWRSYWQVDEQRAGRSARLSDETVDSLEEALMLVATGRAIALTHKSTGRFYARPGLQFLPVIDLGASTLAVAWRDGAEDPAVAAFVEAALEATVGRRSVAGLA